MLDADEALNSWGAKRGQFRMWAKFKTFVVGLATLITVMGLFAQIGPNNARSNLSEWLAALGVQSTPRFVQSPDFDFYATSLALLIVLSVIIGIGIDRFFTRPARRKRDLVSLGNSMTMIAFQLGGMIGREWLYEREIITLHRHSSPILARASKLGLETPKFDQNNISHAARQLEHYAGNLGPALTAHDWNEAKIHARELADEASGLKQES